MNFEEVINETSKNERLACSLTGSNGSQSIAEDSFNNLLLL